MEIEKQIEAEKEDMHVQQGLDLNDLSNSLNIVDVRILMHFYHPEPIPYVFKFLYNKFRKYGWKEDMIRYRLRRLANKGLIEIVPKTKPLCILPVHKHENQLRLLVMAMLGKFDLKK
jgi:hypothetical protein